MIRLISNHVILSYHKSTLIHKQSRGSKSLGGFGGLPSYGSCIFLCVMD